MLRASRMSLPRSTLSGPEAALLRCLADHPNASPPYSLPLRLACGACGVSAVALHALVWGLRDPRRFTTDLVVVDSNFSPPLVRLTSGGLRAAAGRVPIQPRLLSELSRRASPSPPAPDGGDP